jgi:hypothetical protein
VEELEEGIPEAVMAQTGTEKKKTEEQRGRLMPINGEEEVTSVLTGTLFFFGQHNVSKRGGNLQYGLCQW